MPCNGNLGWFPELRKKNIKKKDFLFPFCLSSELQSPIPAQPRAAAHVHACSPGACFILTQKEEPKPPEPIPLSLSPILVDSQETGMGCNESLGIQRGSRLLPPQDRMGSPSLSHSVPSPAAATSVLRGKRRIWDVLRILSGAGVVPAEQHSPLPRIPTASGIRIWLLQGGLLSPPVGEDGQQEGIYLFLLPFPPVEKEK